MCYINSATQMLFHCRPFREHVLAWKPFNKEKYYLLNELSDLFKTMVITKGNRGIVSHRRFISRIRAGNAQFNNEEHHDSHEFIQWLIDEINMNVMEDYKFHARFVLRSKEYVKERQDYLCREEVVEAAGER